MNFLEALERAQNDKEVKNLKNYLLGSLFASLKPTQKSISEWTLHFYNPETKNIRNCIVNDSITLGNDEPAVSKIKELDMKNAKTQPEELVEKIKTKYKEDPIQILITLHQKEKLLAFGQ